MQNSKPALMPEAEQYQWLRLQAERTLAAKGGALEDLQIVEQTLSSAYGNIYRAVAFDVDGTLTVQGDVSISRGMATIVAGLLLRGVPLLLISGRGRRSVRQAVEEILSHSNLHPSYLRRLRCVTHNGLFYLSTPNEFPANPLSDEREIAEPLVKVDELQAELRGRLKSAQIDTRITTEPTGPNPYALRVVASGVADPAAVKAIISEAANSVGMSNFHVCVGAYGNEVSVDVSSTHKGKALEIFAIDVGIDVEEILCVGDRGDEEGNDFDLLKHNNGFSVGTFSQDLRGSHPIVSDDGTALLEGATATSALLNRVLLFPAISITAEPIDQRLASLRSFERVALQRAREETALTLSKVRNRLRYLLDPRSRDGILPTLSLDDLLDERSGAIRLRDYEIPDIGEYSQVSELFGLAGLGKRLSEPPKAEWWMFTDSSVLLRGPSYYYAMTNEDKRLIGFLPSCMTFLRRAIDVLRLYKSRRVTLASFKILLGILDNVRNFLLLATHAAFETETELSLEGYLRTTELYSLLVDHAGFFIEILIGPAAPWRELVENLEVHIEKVEKSFELINSSEDGADVLIREHEIRVWRECDNFLENYTAVQLALSEFAEQYGRRPEQMCVMGLAYGGMELPAIAKAIGARQGWELTSGLCKISIYHDRAAGEAIRSGDSEALREKMAGTKGIFFDIPRSEGEEDRPIVIADDNCTTGKTLQLARDFFVAKGADVRGALVVRFPGANRHVQMAIPGLGFPDPEMLFSFIRGLVAPSPYSRLLFPGTGDDRFKDNLGIFCKSRERISRYLEKNGTPPISMKG